MKPGRQTEKDDTTMQHYQQAPLSSPVKALAAHG
jgi:hypothetical protein